MDTALQPVPGFERSRYALQQGRVVWAGDQAHTDHPRNARQPWQPAARRYEREALQRGAAQAWGLLQDGTLPIGGWLAWLCGQGLTFPWQGATPRLDALRHALHTHDLATFEAAALRLLGLGPGLTPSGDDLLGGVMFTLAHAPLPAWRAPLPALAERLGHAAALATNPISAALLADLLDGRSYRALHDLLDALHDGDNLGIEAAATHLLALGASSGADLLAGVLLALRCPSQPERH